MPQLFRCLEGNHCYNARFNPSGDISTGTNVDGTTAAAAVIVMNVLLRIQWIWFRGQFNDGLWAFVVQSYSILISTLWSTRRQELSLFDANFALVLTSSPMAIDVALGPFRAIRKCMNGLYERPYPPTVVVLGALTLPLWLALTATLRFAEHGYTDSELCEGSTLSDWFWDLLYSIMRALLPGFLWTPSAIILSILALLCPEEEVLALITSPAYESESHLRLPIWDRIRYRWTKTMIYVISDVCWAVEVIHLSTAASGKMHLPSYGYITTLFVVIFPLISTTKLVVRHRKEVIKSFQDFTEPFVIIP